MKKMACNSKEKGGLFSRPSLRGKDLNLRPLGYEHNLMVAGPFVSKHFVTLNVRFYPLFSNFCEHFVSTNSAAEGFKSSGHWPLSRPNPQSR